MIIAEKKKNVTVNVTINGVHSRDGERELRLLQALLASRMAMSSVRRDKFA